MNGLLPRDLDEALVVLPLALLGVVMAGLIVFAAWVLTTG